VKLHELICGAKLTDGNPLAAEFAREHQEAWDKARSALTQSPQVREFLLVALSLEHAKRTWALQNVPFNAPDFHVHSASIVAEQRAIQGVVSLISSTAVAVDDSRRTAST
jgi:hypothetical protein